MIQPKPACMAIGLLYAFCCLFSCNNNSTPTNMVTVDSSPKGSYAYDAQFLKKHTNDVYELTSPDSSSKVLLSAQYQGRVMTSTAMGDSGISFGWLNYNLIAAKDKRKQFNPVGGEERFWMGPEGGQYSIYFKQNDSFNIAHWQVPSFIDTDAYKVVRADANSATFSADASITNYSGTKFNLHIDRRISLLAPDDLKNILHTAVPAGLHFTGFETVNTITNTSQNDWVKEKGLLSVWLLGMFTPGPQTKIIIPFHGGPDAKKHITSDYFGPIPPERLQMADSNLVFTCDGKYRSKIGLSPLIAKAVAAAFDFEKNVLTIVIPQVDKNGDYVNSKWELQKEPYKGDVINAYNDGPLADGTQLGPFFEIESSSAALALQRSASGTYRQTTCHFQGDYVVLKQLAQQLLAVDLDVIKHAKM